MAVSTCSVTDCHSRDILQQQRPTTAFQHTRSPTNTHPTALNSPCFLHGWAASHHCLLANTKFTKTQKHCRPALRFALLSAWYGAALGSAGTRPPPATPGWQRRAAACAWQGRLQIENLTSWGGQQANTTSIGTNINTNTNTMTVLHHGAGSRHTPPAPTPTTICTRCQHEARTHAVQKAAPTPTHHTAQDAAHKCRTESSSTGKPTSTSHAPLITTYMARTHPSAFIYVVVKGLPCPTHLPILLIILPMCKHHQPPPYCTQCCHAQFTPQQPARSYQTIYTTALCPLTHLRSSM